jgi:hypothetical protein
MLLEFQSPQIGADPSKSWLPALCRRQQETVELWHSTTHQHIEGGNTRGNPTLSFYGARFVSEAKSAWEGLEADLCDTESVQSGERANCWVSPQRVLLRLLGRASQTPILPQYPVAVDWAEKVTNDRVER